MVLGCQAYQITYIYISHISQSLVSTTKSIWFYEFLDRKDNGPPGLACWGCLFWCHLFCMILRYSFTGAVKARVPQQSHNKHQRQTRQSCLGLSTGLSVGSCVSVPACWRRDSTGVRALISDLSSRLTWASMVTHTRTHTRTHKHTRTVLLYTHTQGHKHQ